MKRQKWERLVLDAHKARVGWYEGHGAQGLFYPINYSNKPTGVPSPVQSERLLSKTQSSKYTFPPVFQGYPEVNATSNIQEHMTFKSLPSQQGQLHADLPGPDSSSLHHGLGSKGGKDARKGAGLRRRNSKLPKQAQMAQGPPPAASTTKARGVYALAKALCASAWSSQDYSP